jgi:hypothetical protein
MPANQPIPAGTTSVNTNPAKNMRLSKAQLAHVPIPRHSIVTVSKTKPAEEATASIASVQPSAARGIRPAAVEQIRPVAAQPQGPIRAVDGAVSIAGIDRRHPNGPKFSNNKGSS